MLQRQCVVPYKVMPARKENPSTSLGYVRTRVRNTCIESCSNYPNLQDQAESAQQRINAAIEAGQEAVGKSVKIICPYSPTLAMECPAFVHEPIIKEQAAE